MWIMCFHGCPHDIIFNTGSIYLMILLKTKKLTIYQILKLNRLMNQIMR